ncbi:MAG: carbonic anhydrase family protein [Bacteroidales bacterium]|nr:carbonic anhydrase family protein [Bacteroidales bacterium]
MKKVFFGATVLAAMMMASCQNKQAAQTENENVETHVLHAQDVDPLTPDQVIELLKEGNKAFVEHHTHNRDAVAQLKESAHDGQHPLAIVLSCIDARVPVEILFDKGVGDIFVTRVAGNVVSGDILGSMEYACGHGGSKVVVVMGHKQCGAVHSACEGANGGNLTDMLSKISPAIESEQAKGTNLEEVEGQNAVSRQNALNMVEAVRQGSEELRELEAEGKIKIVAAMFDLETGLVEFI